MITMKNAPVIYVVLEEFSDYGLRSCEPIAWFFDKNEADNWAESQVNTGTSFIVEQVEPGYTED